MKKWIVRILIAVLAIGAFAAVGFLGYRVGFGHGARSSVNLENLAPFAERSERDKMPDAPFGFQNHEFQRGFPQREFQMRHGGGFGFSAFMFLGRIALLGLIIWLAYMIFKGNGWQLSLARVQPVESLKTETESPKKKTAKKDS